MTFSAPLKNSYLICSLRVRQVAEFLRGQINLECNLFMYLKTEILVMKSK